MTTVPSQEIEKEMIDRKKHMFFCMELIALEDRFVALEMPNIVAVAMLLQNEDPSQSSFSLEESMACHLPSLLSILPKHSVNIRWPQKMPYPYSAVLLVFQGRQEGIKIFF